MTIRSTITFMSGGRIPQDVMSEQEFVMSNVHHMDEALQMTRLQIPKNVKDAKTAKQIVITIWEV